MAPVAIVWSPACARSTAGRFSELVTTKVRSRLLSSAVQLVLTYAISAFRNDFLSRRATDHKNELLDGLSETVFAVATGYKIRRPLHFGGWHCPLQY